MTKAPDPETYVAGLSDEDLMRNWTDVGQRFEDDKELLRAFSHEHQRRVRKRQLAAVAADMSDEDLALLQEARAEGIESEEAVDNG